jgi:7-cyano-7-deazaguanine reductase
LVIDYVPHRRNVELKSLKLYMGSYRSEGVFHEAVTNRILDDLVQATTPRFMRICAKWYVRGGIFTTVVAEYRKRGWKQASPVVLGHFDHGTSNRG